MSDKTDSISAVERRDFSITTIDGLWPPPALSVTADPGRDLGPLVETSEIEARR